MKVADIFPYQIKDRNLFLDRDHESVELLDHDQYWDTQIRKCIEGAWINDKGTWVFMIPKLWFYINIFIVEVTDEYLNRVPGKPDLTDREWIIFTYFFCCQGFSGFAGDDLYTCNQLVGKIEAGETLERDELRDFMAAKGILNKEGKLKKYVEPWHYLTRHYLLEHPQGKPLGVPLYENPLSNALVFGARGSAKTYCSAGYDGHQLFLGGIQRWEDIGLISTAKVRMGIGSADSFKVKGYADCIKMFWKYMPGGIKIEGEVRLPPLYRHLAGSWGEGELKHEYRDEDGNIKGSGSLVNQGVYRVGNAALFVAGRYTDITEDEVGLNPDVRKSVAAEANTMIDKARGSKKIGISKRLGTSGFLEYIDGVMDMFYNPERFDIFGIPNYWEDPSKKIALFVGDYYVSDAYKDDNGNTLIQKSYEHLQKVVLDLEAKGASGDQIRAHEQNNPNWPSQMFMNDLSSILPTDLAKVCLIKLMQSGNIKNSRVVGHLKRTGPTKVIFERDPRATVVDTYVSDTTKVTKDNGIIIYEEPIENAPKGLYKIVYDTVRLSTLGKSKDASMCCVYVYKGYDSSGVGIQNNIVAVLFFRLDSLTKNHDKVVEVCDYYHAEVLYEGDVGDFLNYCITRNRTGILAATPAFNDEKLKITGDAHLKVGVNIGENPVLKGHFLGKLKEWLTTYTGPIDEDGNQKMNIHYIKDPGTLDEIAKFGEGNFDRLSCLIILMIWIYSEAEKVYETGPTKTNTNNMREIYAKAMQELGQENLKKTQNGHRQEEYIGGHRSL